MTIQEALERPNLIVPGPRHDPFPDDGAMATLAAEVRRLNLQLNCSEMQLEAFRKGMPVSPSMQEMELLRQDIARLADVFSKCSNSVTMIAATFPNASDYIGQMEREIASIKDKQSIASMLMSFEVRKAPKAFPSGNKRYPHWYKLELFSDGSGRVVDSNTAEILFTFIDEEELIYELTQ